MKTAPFHQKKETPLTTYHASYFFHGGEITIPTLVTLCDTRIELHLQPGVLFWPSIRKVNGELFKFGRAEWVPLVQGDGQGRRTAYLTLHHRPAPPLGRLQGLKNRNWRSCMSIVAQYSWIPPQRSWWWAAKLPWLTAVDYLPVCQSGEHRLYFHLYPLLTSGLSPA